MAARLFLRHYDETDQLVAVPGPATTYAAGDARVLTWTIPQAQGQPVATIGVEVTGSGEAGGTLYLDYLSWDGAPDVKLDRPGGVGEMWRRAWVNGVDQFEGHWPEPYRVVQNRGTGLLMQGTQEWTDYRVTAPVSIHLAKASGIAARVGGLRRYYALLLCDDGAARLVKALDSTIVLGEIHFPWDVRQTYELSLSVIGVRIQGSIDGETVFDVIDADRPLHGGGIGLICEEGCLSSGAVRVQPV
jgi:hypothetical protein